MRKGPYVRTSIALLIGIGGLLGSSLIALGDPAPATPATAPAAAAAPISDPNEIICKTMDPATGTRLGARRVCQSAAQWNADQQQAQRELQLNQTRGLQAGVPGN
jgi:hypothetical protein